VGEVAGIRFDSKDYKAVVSLRIDPQYNQIPEDSFASIETQGLLGGKYVGISPGGLESYLKEGGRIDQTQSAIVLENLINKFFASYSSKGGGDSQGKAADNQSKAESKK
jgi:phospholipid/cholesterol/gamma-HCH transport system substrate-binding protein